MSVPLSSPHGPGGPSDGERIARTHNTARFFTETRQISWVLLIGTLLWGLFAYRSMPQRKDPEIPVRVALATCAWPGASAERIEQLVTRKMEEKIAENSKIKRITSNTRTGIAVVTVQFTDDVEDTARELDDIGGRLGTLRGLPDGAGPVNFIKDFGDTAALLLTVASPPIGRVEIDLRGTAVRQALAKVRAELPRGRDGVSDDRVAIVYGFPRSISPDVIQPPFALFARYAEEQKALADVRFFAGSGFVGLDAVSPLGDRQLLALGQRFIHERLRASEIHPDAWQPVTIRDPKEIESRLTEVAGDKYSNRELQDVTDLVRRTLQTVPQVAKVTRSGILEERIYLSYSQEQLASYGLRPQTLPDLLKARNSAAPGGVMEVGEKTLRIDPAGELHSEKEIGDVLVPVAGATPTYLCDLVQIARARPASSTSTPGATARAPGTAAAR